MNRKQKQAKTHRFARRQQLKKTFGDYASSLPEYARTYRSPYLSKSERRELIENQRRFGRFADLNKEYAALKIIGRFYMKQEPYAKKW